MVKNLHLAHMAALAPSSHEQSGSVWFLHLAHRVALILHLTDRVALAPFTCTQSCAQDEGARDEGAKAAQGSSSLPQLQP